jgi:ATPase subunit of ABC transporter with duplicated ATPase domains
MLGDTYLIDFLIDTKRKEIANSQPFELLDGDLLEMPKNIIQKSFEGFTDKVAVISILGPQSSGKSTLLNFLFGCDFSTSEGRCTKGIYGTYFKFSNISLPNCDGVFLLDTEGLFANLNRKDKVKRKKDFDAKLVLFCLAVSNIVIINTKGNLDSESTRILQSSRDRIKALEK